MNVSEGDLHDFKEIVIRNDLLPNDFTLECVNKAIKDHQKVDYLEAQFLVTRVSSGIAQYYDAGPGTLWIERFERDLQQGIFNA